MRKKTIIITGHYGCGKTNFALNFAKTSLAAGERPVLVDLDVVNPYFRSSDYAAELKGQGIKVIAPLSAGTTLDIPALSPEIYSVFSSAHSPVIFDVGGDDVGSRALGRFHEYFIENGVNLWFVVNQFRPEIENPADAAGNLREIEQASRLKATGIVNNSHLCGETTAVNVFSSLDYAKEVCKLTCLPLIYTVVEKRLFPEAEKKVPNPFPAEILVRTPFQMTVDN